jgi:hypothetical protein
LTSRVPSIDPVFEAVQCLVPPALAALRDRAPSIAIELAHPIELQHERTLMCLGVTYAAAATATATATAAAVAVAVAVAKVTTMLDESVACRFALEGEGVKFESGVEGVWINGMGAAGGELGGMPLLVDVADADDASFLLPDERGVGCDA